MATSTSWARRQLRWLLPGRGSLARGWDRIEGAVALAVLVLSLAAVPAAVLAGSNFHAREVVVAEAQRADRHPATATLLTPTAPDVVSEAGPVSVAPGVAARWRLTGGAERTGMVQAGPGLQAGATVPIWLNSAGDPVSPPMSDVTVAGLAIGLGALTWAAATLALLLVYWAVRGVLDRLRAAGWSREWERVGGKFPSRGDPR